jgi:molybdopterin-guanine dinucleotide biosynthesis protein B
MPAVISIVGKSDSGKTTLLEKLVSEFRKRGYRVGTIKHNVHGFDIDHEGKDSQRHKRAGAQAVALSSPSQFALIRDVERELTIDEIISDYLVDMDVVLTEGYKKEEKPKIEIFRKDGPHQEILCKHDKNLIAMVTDAAMQIHVPCFGLDDMAQLADFLKERYF